MGLEHLPEEVLVLILKQLDLKSVYNLYDANVPHVQNVIALGCIKSCDISRSTMATINTLKTNFFKDISTNLTKLDLKGVQDLTRKALLPTMERMENLTTLNVAYTNITIFDFLRIYDQCPTIKNICIDYQFTHNKDRHFSQDLLLKCQEVFGNMETVHFVGSKQNLLQSQLPQLMLQKAKLSCLTYTLVKSDEMMTYYRYVDCEPIIFNNLNIFTPIWRKYVELTNTSLDSDNRPSIFKQIDFNDYEFITVNESEFRVANCTPVFEKFLEQNFGQKPKVKYLMDHYYDSFMNACFLWNKKRTTFDEAFFKNLLLKIAPLFPCKIYRDYEDFEEYSDYDEDDIILKSDWIWVTCDNTPNANYHPMNKRKLGKMSYCDLDYDFLLRDKNNVELNISFNNTDCHIPVSLSPESNYIEKLSFLSLMEGAVYKPDFFYVLFNYAKNLETLNIQFEPTLQYQSSYKNNFSLISKHIGLSKTLKNLRIVAKGLFKKRFRYKDMCQCRTLENLILSDTSVREVKDIGNPELLIEHCKNLYYLCIEVFITKTFRNKKLKLLNKAKNCNGQHHLYIEFKSQSNSYRYNPFIEVFRLGKIKSIDM